jgi:hypothetical protein
MTPIGYYKQPTSPTEHHHTPIYGQRTQYLPIPKRTTHQALILYLGEPTWINVAPQDITLYNN